jgi:extracellular factor (EF) 3-hydroxypalmitic acid methyl ester biosynthesis protein
MTRQDVANSTEQVADNIVLFRNSQGEEVRGTLMRLSRNQAVFEVYNPYSIVQLSEVLEGLCIRRQGRMIYDGRAVVSNLVSTGLMLIVSATLVDPWSELINLEPGEGLRTEVRQFVGDWEGRYQSIQPSYLTIVNRLRNFFEELSRWLNHSETAAGLDSVRASPKLKQEFTDDVAACVDGKMIELCGTFEQEAAGIDGEVLPFHKEYARRELHPLMLCSPFIHRTFSKPLGYAGDYEMVNMMFRDPWEGANTYAKLINGIIIRSDGAKAHRNRIDRLYQHLNVEAERVFRKGRPLRVLNVGCGPAVEIQRFLRQSSLADNCILDLVDFNDVTLAYTKRMLDEAMRAGGRTCKINLLQESIHNLLKGRGQTLADAVGDLTQAYDLVYCAGLFDYISERVCARMMRMFADWTRPDGLVIATNVHPGNPVRQFIEHILEWNLIYRNQADMRALTPEGMPCEIVCEPCGVNVFLEIRKPVAALQTT